MSTCRNYQIKVLDENDPLKLASIYGDIGTEAVLAQIYPQETSLFFNVMDVIQARRESKNYKHELENLGTEVIEIRPRLIDFYKNTFQELKVKGKVKKLIQQKLEKIYQKYSPSKVIEFYQDQFETLYSEDIKKYGKSNAEILNWGLCLSNKLPLGNMLYSRDQMNVVYNKMIVSNLAKPIRKPESEIYRQIYSEIFGKLDFIEIPQEETFEGGDLYIHDGVVYTGVGSRTTRKAAIHIAKEIEDKIIETNSRFIIVEDPDPLERSFDDQMNFMHLDTWSYPIGRKQIMLLPEEAKRRRIFEVHFDKQEENDTRLEIINRETSFYEFLEDEGYTIFEVNKETQQDFGCNNVCYDEDIIIVPQTTNDSTLKILQKAGKETVCVPMYESTRGYGAAHCMTGQLIRG